MPDKIKISFAVKKNFQEDFHKQIITDGYGLRGKSKWVEEAICFLLETPDYIRLVYISDEMEGFDKKESISVSYAIKKKLDDAVICIRNTHPTLEGLKSRIIRTAILQRLLRGGDFQSLEISVSN